MLIAEHVICEALLLIGLINNDKKVACPKKKCPIQDKSAKLRPY